MVTFDRTRSTRALMTTILGAALVLSSTAACTSGSPERAGETSPAPTTRALASTAPRTAGGSTPTGSVASSPPAKSTAVPPVAPPASTSGSPAETAQTAATRWAQAWCGWDYRRPYLARERAARSLMTPAGAKDLEVTPAGEWQSEVVAPHQVATCTGLSVHFAEGGGSARLAYVRMAATRTVTDDNGVTASPFLDQRRVVLEHGRWLVDQRVQGG